MAKQITGVHDQFYEYQLDSSLREADILRRLREETNQMQAVAAMQISPDQGQFMALMVKLLNAGKILEIGCFTGYSALAMAMAQAEAGLAGRIVSCDLSEEWTAIAKRYWQEAGYDKAIELHLGKAEDTLEALLQAGDKDFDMAFIDADKVNLQNYFEYCLKLLRPGGLVMIDNVFWGGDVMNPDKNDDDTSAIRRFNKQLADDERVDVTMLAIGDGLTLARIKS